MTSVSKKFDFKSQIVQLINTTIQQYNHRTIKIQPADVRLRTFIDFNKETNQKDPKFEVGDPVKLLRYKKHFCKRLHSKLVRRSFYD